MLCQTYSVFSASLMLIHKSPAEAYPGLPCRHLERLGSCTLSFWFPNNMNKLDSSTICKVPWKNVHINAKLSAQRAGNKLTLVLSFTLTSGLSRQLMTRAKYCCILYRAQPSTAIPAAHKLPFFYLKQSRDWARLVSLYSLIMHLSLPLQSGRLQGLLVSRHSPLFSHWKPACAITQLSVKTYDEKSCLYLMTATHLFPGRVRPRKREHFFLWYGIQWAPQNLLNFSKYYLLWDF